jgi:hypothetical protein
LLTKLSANNGTMREIEFAVPRDADLTQATKLIEKICARHELILAMKGSRLIPDAFIGTTNGKSRRALWNSPYSRANGVYGRRCKTDERRLGSKRNCPRWKGRSNARCWRPHREFSLYVSHFIDSESAGAYTRRGQLSWLGVALLARSARLQVKIEIAVDGFQSLGKAVKIGHGPATVIGCRWDARFFNWWRDRRTSPSNSPPVDSQGTLKVREPTRAGRS